MCTGVESRQATDQFALRLVSSSPLTEQLCKWKGRESSRVLGWGLRGVHTSEGTEGSRAKQPVCGSAAGNQTSLCYPHRKQTQSTMGCWMHVGPQQEPTLGIMRKVREECSPAQPNYFREGTAHEAARDKTMALDRNIWIWRLPVLEHRNGHAHLQWGPSMFPGAGAGWEGWCWSSVWGLPGLLPPTKGMAFSILGWQVFCSPGTNCNLPVSCSFLTDKRA